VLADKSERIEQLETKLKTLEASIDEASVKKQNWWTNRLPTVYLSISLVAFGAILLVVLLTNRVGSGDSPQNGEPSMVNTHRLGQLEGSQYDKGELLDQTTTKLTDLFVEIATKEPLIVKDKETLAVFNNREFQNQIIRPAMKSWLIKWQAYDNFPESFKKLPVTARDEFIQLGFSIGVQAVDWSD
jgi:hypothetical protein